MRYVYLVLGIIAITVITLVTFCDDEIYYYYAKFGIKDEVIENEYHYEDNFIYVDEYKENEIHNKEELYNTVYYLVNSGARYAKRYFNIDYVDYEKDYSELFSDENKLNIINSFVHPYNSFDYIEASLKGYSLEITIKYDDMYNEEKQEEINTKVNSIIAELIKNNMKDKEKIEVIHDYIVNNTTYDKDFCVTEENCVTTSIYNSDTAYGVLFQNNGICSGYTDLMAIFLAKLGIVNYRVTNETHTWNAVMLDDKWYILDVTWDDPISDRDVLSHTYFLITSKEDSLLKETHTYNKNIFVELN